MTAWIEPASPSTLTPSRANVYKSKVYREIGARWSASLKVDHDARNRFSLPRFRRALPALRRMGTITLVRVYTTAKGHHLRVWMVGHRARCAPGTDRLPATSILRLQALLGDDPIRQKWNAARVRRGEPFWDVLWTIKLRNGVVTMRETLDPILTAAAERICGMSPPTWTPEAEDARQGVPDEPPTPTTHEDGR